MRCLLAALRYHMRSQSANNGRLEAVLLAATMVLAAAPSQAAPAATVGRVAQTANTTTFQDSVAEEDARAPDVSTVVVSNDDAGLLAFEIHFANRATLAPSEELSLWFNTDGNPANGGSGRPTGSSS